MNLLMTLDRNYVPQLNVMLFSALHSDSAAYFDVYLLHDEGACRRRTWQKHKRCWASGRTAPDTGGRERLADAPTSDRYPKSHLLPYFCGKISAGHTGSGAVSRPDIVVRQSLRRAV